MMMGLEVLIVLCYWAVMLEDLKDRSVRVAWLIAVSVLTVIYRYFLQAGDVVNALLNFALITFMLLSTTLYFLIRYKNKGKSRLVEQLGAGDLILLYVTAGSFDLPITLAVLMLSFIAGIVGYFIVGDFKNRGVPLAGILAGMCILTTLIKSC